jgi:hypothetical protein
VAVPHAGQESPENLKPVAGAAAAILRDCDAKLARYRAALAAGADPVVVTGWISQVQAERTAAEALLTGTQPSKTRPRMSADEIRALVDQLGDILGVLARADPAGKAEVPPTRHAPDLGDGWCPRLNPNPFPTEVGALGGSGRRWPAVASAVNVRDPPAVVGP